MNIFYLMFGFLVTSGSENESIANRRRLGKVVESRNETEVNNPASQLVLVVGHTVAPTILENEDRSLKSPLSSSLSGNIPRKLANDIAQVRFEIMKCFVMKRVVLVAKTKKKPSFSKIRPTNEDYFRSCRSFKYII